MSGPTSPDWITECFRTSDQCRPFECYHSLKPARQSARDWIIFSCWAKIAEALSSNSGIHLAQFKANDQASAYLPGTRTI